MSKKNNKGKNNNFNKARNKRNNNYSKPSRTKHSSLIHYTNTVISLDGKKPDKRTCIYYNKETTYCANKRCSKTICTTAHNCTCYKRKEPVKNKLSNYDDTYIQQPDQAGTHERTNEYIAVSKAIGTPCHVGYMKNPGQRRHKARCIYYDKSNKQCKYYKFKCIGSSRCEKYEERKAD